MTGRLGQVGAGLAALALVATVMLAAAVPAGAASASDAPTQTPDLSVDVTKDVHKMEWGTSNAALLKYEDDSGNVAQLQGAIDDSADNPVEFVASDVNFSDASAFPHAKGDVSALTASEWSTGTGVTVSDVTTAPGVEALNVATNGSFATGDTATASFSNFSVTGDVAKRYLQLVLDVDSLDSGAVVSVRAVDSDGDYKEAVINTSRSSGEDFVTNATGEGIVYQRQLGKMPTQGSGDGTFAEIQSVELVVEDADAEVSISALNVEKMAKWTFGQQLYQADGDDELESRTVTEHKTGGALSITSLSTLGGDFDSATLHGVTMPLVQDATALPNEDRDVSFESADAYPSYDSITEQYYRFALPSAYDLSYANAALTDTVELPGNRYTTVEVAEGTGDTAFGDISSWTSVTASYDAQGANVTLDDTIQPGTPIVVHYRYLVTGSEKSEIQGSAVMGPVSGGGAGGIVGFLSSPFGAIATLLGGLWGVPKLLGGVTSRFGG